MAQRGLADEAFEIKDFVSQADGGGKEDKVLLKVNFKHLGGLNLSQGFGVRDAASPEN